MHREYLLRRGTRLLPRRTQTRARKQEHHPPVHVADHLSDQYAADAADLADRVASSPQTKQPGGKASVVLKTLNYKCTFPVYRPLLYAKTKIYIYIFKITFFFFFYKETKLNAAIGDTERIRPRIGEANTVNDRVGAVPELGD